jgi:hypothetical protein
MYAKLPDGRRVPTYYQLHPVLGFMVKRQSDGRYWDEDAFRFKGRDYWVLDHGTIHEFDYANYLMRMASDSPCEVVIVVDRLTVHSPKCTGPAQ